jgi:two-component system response regulator RegX3
VVEIVVVGGDPAVTGDVARLLGSGSQRVVTASDATTAGALVRTRPVDLLLFVLPVPRLSVAEACTRIRRFSPLPVLVVGPREEHDTTKLAAFHAGADDYLEVPFNPSELTARAAALVRRGRRSEPNDEVIDAGDILIDRRGAEVTVRGKHMLLPRKEFELLSVLVDNSGRVIGRRELLRCVWGEGYTDRNRTLDVHVKRLRERIERDPHRPRHLVTIRGIGYKFSP